MEKNEIGDFLLIVRQKNRKTKTQSAVWEWGKSS